LVPVEIISSSLQHRITMETSDIFPKGQPLSKDWFTGDAFLSPLVGKDHNNDFSAGSVSFEPKARTNWHTHPRGQVLLIIEGEGYY
jgi:quercetin dioxygenase-like cupin family protein